MDGFTYNGIHCSTYNVGYIPDASARWWADADFEIYQKDVAWRNGGYYYGNAVKMRTIELKCYYDEIDIATREKIRRWLDRRTSGQLIFDERPFVYYIVRPQAIVSGAKYLDTAESNSGTFNIKFILENPFGYLTRKSQGGSDPDDGAVDYCGMIQSANMPNAPTTSDREFNIYNPGTESCGLSIVVKGTATNPIRFFNAKNQTMCILNTLPSNKYLDINGDTGNIIRYADLNNTASNEPAFENHDYGYIRLDPNRPYENIAFTSTADGTTYTVTLSGLTVTDEMINGMINSGLAYLTVIAVNKTNNSLTCTLTSFVTLPASGTLDLFLENHIVIEEKDDLGNWITPTGLTLSYIKVDYAPRIM